jgi:pectate lyase
MRARAKCDRTTRLRRAGDGAPYPGRDGRVRRPWRADGRFQFFHLALVMFGMAVAVAGNAAEVTFKLLGFAAVEGDAAYGSRRAGGTTGGAGGPRVQVWTTGELVKYLQTNSTLMVEIMTNLDLSGLSNHSGGFPANYPTGEILVRSNKTIYSKNGSTISRGTLRIGKPSLGPQQNIIIRNLKFRDLWVLDPSGNYDTYGWDYIHLEQSSHHVWVDHCDFERVYDGMLDLSHGCDFVTASWNVFRSQKKCSLVGHSDSNQLEDTNHLNVTYHHNWFADVDERMPRMRFGNAHVFNNYCENLGGKGVQSTCGAAALVENCYFYHPAAGSYPTIEANGGPTGTVKVANSIIVNLPGNNIAFRQYGATNFSFNWPFAGAAPPYPYPLDPVADVPALVTNRAGVGKIGFELWQMEQFTSGQLTNAAISGPDAAPAGDGVANFVKYALGLAPFAAANPPLTLFRLEPPDEVLIYRRPATATDVNYRVTRSPDLALWAESGVVQQLVSTDNNGLQTWEARYPNPGPGQAFLRLLLSR